MAGKYQNIRRTPTFIAAYSEVSSYLRRTSPVAYHVLPSAMMTILDVIAAQPRAWPIKRKMLAGIDHEFHLAIMDLAYRRIHVRYHVDDDEISHLLAVWVDGQDEPNYVIGSSKN
jgi:hypothetical protein